MEHRFQHVFCRDDQKRPAVTVCPRKDQIFFPEDSHNIGQGQIQDCHAGKCKPGKYLSPFAVKQEEDCQHEYQDHMLQRFRKFLVITALQHIFQCCKEDQDAKIDPDQCQGKVSVMLIQIRNTATGSDRVGDQE